MSEKSKVSKVTEIISQVTPYFLAVISAFVAAGVFLYIMGFDVFEAYKTILFTSFKSKNGFVQTLLKFTPLVLMALAFTIPQ
ncbi:MAG: ABC transporter permease, partial [Chloroflexota bacterium]